MEKIFISYRRQDSQDTVGRIYDHLVKRFGSRAVFKDVDSIPPGADFHELIKKKIREVDVMLIIIGSDWLNVKNTDGKRCIDDLNDFVRIEIEAALKNKILVLPILLGNTKMPDIKELPITIEAIVHKNAIRIRPDPDFRPDIKRLSRWLNKNVGSDARRAWFIALIFVTIFPLYFFALDLFVINKTDDKEKSIDVIDIVVKGLPEDRGDPDVRGSVEQSSEPPYVELGEQTVTIFENKLMWEKARMKDLDWLEARDWVEEANRKNYLGYKDWRLPSRYELLDLRKIVISNPGIFSDVNKWHWSNDNENLLEAWVVNLKDAKQETFFFNNTQNPEAKSKVHAVRLVRDRE